MTTPCKAVTAKGLPCPFSAREGSDVCAGHADSETKARNGMAGGVKFSENRAAVREAIASTLTVRTVDGQLSTLDAVLSELMTAKIDSAKRAAAVAQIVKCARDVLATGEIAEENSQLREELIKRHPELSKALKVVK